MWRELFTRARAGAARARGNNSRHTSLLPPKRIGTLAPTEGGRNAEQIEDRAADAVAQDASRA